MKNIAAGLIAAIASVTALAADVSPENPVGWRGNWTGSFPDAAPPITWERRCKTRLNELRYSSRKPKGEDATGAFAPATQSITHWLIAGPFKPKDPGKTLDEEEIPNEAALSPDDGDKAGETEWKALDKKSIEETFLADSKSDPDAINDGIEFTRMFSKESVEALPVQGAAYAHTYLYSPQTMTVALLVKHDAGLKAWLNGKVVYNNGAAVKCDCVNASGFTKFEWHWGQAQTVSLSLEKGWNRLLLKNTGNRWGWSLDLRLTAPADAGYETKNIAWETKLPTRGHSGPIVVGNRIFLAEEVDELVCIDKKDGRILWRRSNSYFDAATPEERAANPLWKDIEPIAAKFATAASYPESMALHHQMQDILVRIDKHRFANSDARFGPTQGNATPTACSDGKHVFVYFSTGIAACYDLNGNRIWIRNNRDIGDIGGYNTQAPALIAGTFVIYRHQVRGLDAKTGEIRWTSGKSNEDERAQCVVPVVIGGEPIVMAHHNHYYRARDGQFLGGGTTVHHATAIVFGNDRVISCVDSGMDQWRMAGIENGAMKMEFFASCGSPFAGTYNVASPLYDNGLVYVLNINGNFMVWEPGDSASKLVFSMKHIDDMHAIVQPWHWNVGYCASPVLGGKYVYLMDNQGTTIVIERGKTFKQVATNKIENYLPRQWVTNTQENTYSSPVCDGNTLYLRGDETLYCIRGVSAVLKTDESRGEAPLPVNFDGRDSFSGNGKIESYAWDFADKAGAATATASHAYPTPGTYVVKLTVTDAAGGVGTVTKTITVGPPDTAAPKVQTVAAGYRKKIVIKFSKTMERTSAENAANYTISPDIKIASAQLSEDSKVVVLSTAPLAEDVKYTLILNNLVDCARKPNSLAANSTFAFQTTALVTHWKLDDGSGSAVSDSSGFANDATVNGATTPAWADGGKDRPGCVLKFNGAESNIVIATNGFPELTSPFSVAVWVNPAQNQEEYADILGNHGEGFSGFVLQQDGKNTNLFSLGYGNGKEWHGAGSAQLTADTWQHLAAVCDGEHAILYLNGVEKARSDSKTPLVPNTRLNFRLGQGFPSARFFRGALSDVRIYSKALTPAEIVELAKPVDTKK
jgi:hypothetical protein